jgi:peptidoglycan lytic transglycosylase
VRKSRRRPAAALFAAATLASACAAQHPRPRVQFPPPVVPPVGTVVTGVASWYGPGYDGNRTSSGEVYDQDGLTAAHFDWAFGTLVRVTFLDNGRSVVVRINDRFPNHKGRVIDLSKGAARAIGLIGPGTGQVRLEVVGPVGQSVGSPE